MEGKYNEAAQDVCFVVVVSNLAFARLKAIGKPGCVAGSTPKGKSIYKKLALENWVFVGWVPRVGKAAAANRVMCCSEDICRGRAKLPPSYFSALIHTRFFELNLTAASVGVMNVHPLFGVDPS